MRSLRWARRRKAGWSRRSGCRPPRRRRQTRRTTRTAHRRAWRVRSSSCRVAGHPGTRATRRRRARLPRGAIRAAIAVPCRNETGYVSARPTFTSSRADGVLPGSEMVIVRAVRERPFFGPIAGSASAVSSLYPGDVAFACVRHAPDAQAMIARNFAARGSLDGRTRARGVDKDSPVTPSCASRQGRAADVLRRGSWS